MLRALVTKLRCPGCWGTPAAFRVLAFAEQGAHVEEGALVCEYCAAWFTIDEGGLLDFVPPALHDPKRRLRFCERWASELRQHGLTAAADASGALGAFDAQREQREHFDQYAGDHAQNYDAYQNTPFWKSVDALTFRTWHAQIRPDAWLLDIGCADGRSAFQFVGHADCVVGFDISGAMIRRAIERSRAMGVYEHTSFFVGDASQPPLQDGSFDYACTYGVLHHLPAPGETCRHIHALLKPGGIFFASENNASAFRKIFDWLMRVRPLWNELAGEEPLIGHEMVDRWFGGLAQRTQMQTMVFLPPHLFNWLGPRLAGRALALTDRLGRAVPGLRKNGGLIVFQVEKKA